MFSMNDGQDGKPMNTRVYFEEDTKMLVIHSIHTIKDKVVVVKRYEWVINHMFFSLLLLILLLLQ